MEAINKQEGLIPHRAFFFYKCHVDDDLTLDKLSLVRVMTHHQVMSNLRAKYEPVTFL